MENIKGSQEEHTQSNSSIDETVKTKIEHEKIQSNDRGKDLDSKEISFSEKEGTKRREKVKIQVMKWNVLYQKETLEKSCHEKTYSP